MYDYREPLYQSPLNYYAPRQRRRFHWTLSLFFMFWFIVLIVPVTFSLFVSGWAVALAFSVVFVGVWLQKEIFPPDWSYNNWLMQQSDVVVYSLATGVTVLGIVLLIAMIKATVPFFKGYAWILRGIWS